MKIPPIYVAFLISLARKVAIAAAGAAVAAGANYINADPLTSSYATSVLGGAIIAIVLKLAHVDTKVAALAATDSPKGY